MKFPSACLSLLALACAVAHAQGYPSKPIRIIQPAPPGGPSDVQIRAIAPLLTQAFGQPIIIENRPGGDGIISAEACAKAPADGYTLCLTQSAVIIGNPLLHSNLPYDPERQFVPIINMGVFTSAILVHPSVPVHNMQELIALAKNKPEAVTWGTASTAPTTSESLYIEWFKKTQDVRFLPVPYKINTQALNGAVAGEVQVVLYAIGGAARLAKSGQLRAIATVDDKRSAYLPDLPTLKEQGVDLLVRSWFGLFGRTGMPEEGIRRLSAEILRVQGDAGFREKYSSAVGLNFQPNTPEEFAAFLRNERAALQKLYAQVGLARD